MISEQMANEEWRQSVGEYEVSSLGRVRRRGRILKPRMAGIDGNQYLSLCICTPELRKKNISVHRLVAWAFIGPQINGMQVNHKDLNKLNNQASNLEYVTRSENVRHAIRARGVWQKIGLLNAKLSPADVTIARGMKAAGYSLREIASRFGVTGSAIQQRLS